jgi:hypothetical protein
MENEQVYVIKVRDREPEVFMMIAIESGHPTRMSYPALSEAEMWARLHKMGIPDDEIKSLLANSRNNQNQTSE